MPAPPLPRDFLTVELKAIFDETRVRYPLVKRRAREWVLVGPVMATRETERALLVKFEGDNKEIWVPKSMLNALENEVWKAGDMGMLILPEWLAKEKGWL